MDNISFLEYKVTLQAALPKDCSVSTDQETCFGAQGAKCVKIPLLDTCGTGMQAVTVGSMAHDTCCRECSEGVACSSFSLPSFFPTVAADDYYPCELEWRKAVLNLLDRRFWCAPITDEASNMTDVPVQRKYDTTTVWGTLRERRGLHHVAATADMCAPAGTHLDCIGCAECMHCVVGIGDSDFCCSRHFSQVHHWFGKSWGTCAAVTDTFRTEINPDMSLRPGMLHGQPIVTSESYTDAQYTLQLFGIVHALCTNFTYAIAFLTIGCVVATAVKSHYKSCPGGFREPLLSCNSSKELPNGLAFDCWESIHVIMTRHDSSPVCDPEYGSKKGKDAEMRVRPALAGDIRTRLGNMITT